MTRFMHESMASLPAAYADVQKVPANFCNKSQRSRGHKNGVFVLQYFLYRQRSTIRAGHHRKIFQSIHRIFTRFRPVRTIEWMRSQCVLCLAFTSSTVTSKSMLSSQSIMLCTHRVSRGIENDIRRDMMRVIACSVADSHIQHRR
jgi:hypothetical protein